VNAYVCVCVCGGTWRYEWYEWLVVYAGQWTISEWCDSDGCRSIDVSSSRLCTTFTWRTRRTARQCWQRLADNTSDHIVSDIRRRMRDEVLTALSQRPSCLLDLWASYMIVWGARRVHIELFNRATEAMALCHNTNLLIYILFLLLLLLYILMYKSRPRISHPPKKWVPMWSKIIDPHISHRWFLRACTGCKVGPVLRLVEAQISNSPNISSQ